MPIKESGEKLFVFPGLPEDPKKVPAHLIAEKYTEPTAKGKLLFA